MSIADNIARIEEKIQKACASTGRKRDEITLMGVSKFMPIGLVEEAFCAGITCFGESKVKEGTGKFESFKKLHPQTQVHLIGHLQRNKAKNAAFFFNCIQSVDREEIIIELAKHTGQLPKPLDFFFELHTGEETKSGFLNFDSLFRAVELVFKYESLKPSGLMTMAPFTDDTVLLRKSFRLLVKARYELEKRFPPKENWKYLSMGMSNDFEIAVEEGSNFLRIGSLIFKE
jgi:pyridoxal phosphate enzyme (YggS family)